MAAWVLTVGTGRESNWTIGRDGLIWATPKRSQIQVDDVLLFWQATAGNAPGMLIGSAIAAETPRYVADPASLPWPDSNAQDYRWSFQLRDVNELDTPRAMRWGEVQRLVGVTGLPQQPRRSNLDRSTIFSNLELSGLGDTARLDEHEQVASISPAIPWTLNPGDYMTRLERQRQFGGSTMGGIQPSNRTSNIFVYSDPTAGDEFGYDFDGWTQDGTAFLYTGEGQNDDQQMTAGNRALSTHESRSKAIRLFVAEGVIAGTQTKNQRYIGEFYVDRFQPYVRASAPGKKDRLLRSVIVFKLIPSGATFRTSGDVSSAASLPQLSVTEDLPVASQRSEVDTRERPIESDSGAQFIQQGSLARIASRKEAAMVGRFQSWLSAEGHETCRQSIRPPGELQTIWTDIFDKTAGVLYEAKASSIRSDVRMAVGQLLDYQRFITPVPRLAVLVPSPPSLDVLKLLEGLGIACMVERPDKSFERVSIGRQVEASLML